MQIRITNDDTNFYQSTSFFSALTTRISFEENSFKRRKTVLDAKTEGIENGMKFSRDGFAKSTAG